MSRWQECWLRWLSAQTPCQTTQRPAAETGRWEGGSETSGSLAWGEDNADIGLKETLSQVYIFGPLQKRHFFMSFFFFLTAAYFEPK